MKPTLPQGTRDFGPDTVRRRNYIFNTIRSTFELYGYQPLETPAFENIDTLLGKYGDEGDRLIFKILNNGLDNPVRRGSFEADFQKVLAGKTTAGITERALRYDLTIPFARYVAMNHGKLTFPFKRYQMQPVWRADRPQKGRYREFYQCDADVVGSYSLVSDTELAQIYLDVFSQLGISIKLKINSRKILTALAQLSGAPELFQPITISIDKLDKIGIDKVMEEISGKGISTDGINTIKRFLTLQGNNQQKIQELTALLNGNPEGLSGIAELEFVLQYLTSEKLEVDLTLARGLNYYTGIIYEVKAEGVDIGSIGGGGRYNDLTGLFDIPAVPGVGISFGVDRIYDVMMEKDIFPKDLQVSTMCLFFNLGDLEARTSFAIMQQLRTAGISCELYHESAKMDKQFKYAERKNIPYVVIIGSHELSEKCCLVKELKTGQQQKVALSDIINHFKNFLKTTI